MASQSMSGKTNYNTDPNHLYYDLQLLNNDTVGAGEILPVRFTETRTSTILANPSEYFLSIQRFSLDTPSLPVFLPEVETRTDFGFNTASDPNQLVYKMAIYQWGSGNPPIMANVKYSNQYDVTISPPPAPLDLEALSNQYYFVYQYRDFIDMLNATLQNLCKGTGETAIVEPPFIDINSSNLVSVYFPQLTTPNTTGPSGIIQGTVNDIWNDDPSQTGKWVLAINSPLWALLSSLQTRYVNSLNQIQATSPTAGQTPTFTPFFSDGLVGSEPTALAGWYVIKVNPVNNPATAVDVYNCNITGGFPAFGQHYLTLDADVTFPFLSTVYTTPGVRSFSVNTTPYSPCPIWNCVRQLIFTTALMPIANELVATPLILNSNPALDNSDANNNFSPIITDLEVPLTRGDETKPTINYSPQAEYRLIDLQSNSPINGIEISIFWKDQYGFQHQFVLEPGCSASIKILFRKKIFNLVNLKEYTEPPNKNI
jgi:hypothetical protein